MKRILAALVVLALGVSVVLAADEAKDMVLKGKIVKVTKENVVTFSINDVVLPAPKDGIKDELIGVDVEVAVKAVVGDDKKVTVKETGAIKAAAKVEAKAEAPKADAAK